MQLIAEPSDWQNEADSTRARRELQHWLDKLATADAATLHAEIVSKEGDWNEGMMGRATEEIDRITDAIFADYAKTPSAGHSLTVVAA